MFILGLSFGLALGLGPYQSNGIDIEIRGTIKMAILENNNTRILPERVCKRDSGFDVEICSPPPPTKFDFLPMQSMSKANNNNNN